MANKVSWIHLIIIITLDIGVFAEGHFHPGVFAKGQFAVLHAPLSMTHVGENDKEIEDDSIKDIYLLALGLTTGITNSSIMTIVNPFDTPEAAVSFHVEGVSSIGEFEDNTRIYPLNISLKYVTFLCDLVEERFSKLDDPKCKLVNMRLSSEIDLQMYSHIFGKYTKLELLKFPFTVFLKHTVEPDHEFLRELQALSCITTAVENGILKQDGAKDFFLFRFRSLKALTRHYGEDSNPALEAKKLLNQQIWQLNKAFMSAYDGNVLFTVAVTDININRMKRHTLFYNNDQVEHSLPYLQEAVMLETEPDKPQDEGHGKSNIAIINIIFWLCISLFYSMIGITYVMISLDPGRDSVVYRMTSQIDRVKME